MMDLENTKTDYIVSGIKGVLNAIPVVGSFVAECICIRIPNQRMDRIKKFTEKLANKIEHLENSRISIYFNDPEFIDLLEDSILQTTKAISDERIEKIAQLLSNGMIGENIEHGKYKRYLFLLSQLTDSEIVKLGGFYYPSQGKSEYYAKHKDTLKNIPPTLESTSDEIENFAIHESHIHHLHQLGLLEAHYNIDKDLGIPEFHIITGKMKTVGFSITELGKSLLKHIDSPI
ncbi:hypothetical protein SDC03_04305 [Legionella pneumophila serogroup 1]